MARNIPSSSLTITSTPTNCQSYNKPAEGCLYDHTGEAPGGPSSLWICFFPGGKRRKVASLLLTRNSFNQHCWQHKSCSFVVRLTNITFGTRTPKEFGVWLHLAGVYYGASTGGGIAFYGDGALVARNTTLTSTPSVIPASGKLGPRQETIWAYWKIRQYWSGRNSALQPEVIRTGSSDDLQCNQGLAWVNTSISEKT